jgi:DNA repair protein RadC
MKFENSFSKSPSDLFPKGVCELIVTYRRSVENRKKVSSAEDVVSFAREQFYSPEVISYCEKFYTLFLDCSNHIFAWKEMSSGGISGTIADPRLIFQTSLLTHSTSLILLHNHPSGNHQPSEQDILLTKNMVIAGKFLEINILDHIILTTANFYSFADDGLI